MDKIRGVGHIGLGVKDIHASVKAFARTFNVPVPEVTVLPDRQMKVALVQLGPISLEFLQDDSENGMLAKFIRDKGDGIHHFCVDTDDIEADVEVIKRRGVEMIHQQPVIGVRGKRIAFMGGNALTGIPIEMSEP